MSVIQVHSSVDLLAPLAAAPGPLTAFQLDDEAYWHQELCLIFTNDYAFRVTAESRCPLRDCPYLECFTLIIEQSQRPAGALRTIKPPFRIAKLSLLRREEWVTPAPEMAGKTVGNNPHVQMSGLPGSPHPEAVAAAVVTAGFLLTSEDGRRIAVLASELAPLNVDFVQDPSSVDTVLQRHMADLGQPVGEKNRAIPRSDSPPISP